MSKRYHDDRDYGPQSHKKPRHDERPSYPQDTSRPLRNDRNNYGDYHKPPPSHTEALAALPPPTQPLGPVPAYTPFTVAGHLPPLPDVHSSSLASASFRHKSTLTTYNRSANAHDVTYEKLEFYGDALLELLATRLLFARFPALTAGQQSQLRELLVKNETLADYARGYGFDQRVRVGDMDRMVEDAKERGNKGFNKVLGDVFEAYVAAVVLSDHEDGFAVAEKWMTALWAPKLVDAAAKERYLTPGLNILHDGPNQAKADMLGVYNPTAKAELQRRLLGGAGVKLEYEPYQKSLELKGDQLGQNRHFIAVYLTGYGYVRYVLGKGEGKNKVEAGNWAAVVAMHGGAKGFVDECEGKLGAVREAKRVAKEAKEAKEEGGAET
ncbi:hypothetical protein LTR08_005998 [Meristemomyces frigidus]|nr:hypothetical protein LTR08_005998 [Meristemomyces frigidus]